MARAEKEGIVIVLDIGSGASRSLEKAKSCIFKILHRKIFTKPKDELGFILMGTTPTNNSLNKDYGGYDHISEAFDMAITNWQMLRIIQSQNSNEINKADWLDSLIVAMNVLKVADDVRKYSSKKIVLFSNFASEVNVDNIDVVINGLQKTDIQLVVINENGSEENLTTDENSNSDEENDVTQLQRKKGEKLIEQIISETDGVFCSFDYALTNLMYFPKKKIKGMPWNSELSIGSNIKINVSAYIYISEDKSIPSWKPESAIQNTKCKTETVYFKNEKQIDVDFDTLIKGYMYGTTVVPIDHEISGDKNSIQSLMCIGFTNSSNILEEYFIGVGSSVVVPKKDCGVSEQMLASLVEAMKDTSTVMIVRRVYRRGTQPKLYVLYPNISPTSYPYLSMFELCFSENTLYFEFPNLKSKSYTPNHEQYETISNLIDSMDLMNSSLQDSKNNELFSFKKTLNPSDLYLYRCIANRALHPNEPLVLPDQELLDMLQIPRGLMEHAKPHLEKIQNIFNLEICEKKTFKHKFQINLDGKPEEPTTNVSNDNSEENTIIEIGTVTPMENFAYLLQKGEKFSTLCIQLQNVVSDLLLKSITNQIEKIAKALVYYREESKILGSHYYNNWIKEFKNLIHQKGKMEFWEDVIVKEGLGLITKNEDNSSTISNEEAEAFYQIQSNSSVPDQQELEMDINDIFDNM